MGREKFVTRSPSKRKIKPTYRVKNAEIFKRRVVDNHVVDDDGTEGPEGAKGAEGAKGWHEPIVGIRTKIITKKYSSFEKSDDEIKDYVNSLVCAKALDLQAYHMDLHGNSEEGKRFINSLDYLGKCTFFFKKRGLPLGYFFKRRYSNGNF